MNRSLRIVALASTVFAIAGPTVAQAERPMPTLKPGLSDFGLTYKGAPARERPMPTLKPGLSDFGLPYAYALRTTQVSAPQAPNTGETATRFDWGDAGIGAGFAAGIAVILVGLLLIAGHRRSELTRA